MAGNMVGSSWSHDGVSRREQVLEMYPVEGAIFGAFFCVLLVFSVECGVCWVLFLGLESGNAVI